MASFSFSCPHCGQKFEADESWIGQSLECPTCKNEIVMIEDIVFENVEKKSPANENLNDGNSVNDTPPENFETMKKISKNKIKNPIVKIVHGIWIMIVLSGFAWKQVKPYYVKYSAWCATQDYVRQRLVSPATADFPFFPEEIDNKHRDDVYIIKSYVDSQNGFGGIRRIHFSVEVMKPT